MRRVCDCPVDDLSQPACTQDHGKAQKDGQTGPGDTIQRGFCTAGAAEHGAATGRNSPHAITLWAVEQHQKNQQHATANPGPRQDSGKHQLRGVGESDRLRESGAQRRQSLDRFDQCGS